MSALCQMTGLSRAGYYRWRLPPPATPVAMELRSQLQQVAVEWPAYGYRRITAELKRRGFEVNHKHVLRLMREDNLLCLRRRSFVVTTDSRHGLPVYPNLAARMRPTAINQLWADSASSASSVRPSAQPTTRREARSTLPGMSTASTCWRPGPVRPPRPSAPCSGTPRPSGSGSW